MRIVPIPLGLLVMLIYQIFAMTCDDVDVALNMFSDVLMHYFNKNCPIKQKTFSYKSNLNHGYLQILSNV